MPETILMQKAKKEYTIDESSFETYLKYEKYEDGFFWMDDRVFFMLEVTGGILYYTPAAEIAAFYQNLNLLFQSIPTESEAVIQSLFLPYRDIIFDTPEPKTDIPSVKQFYSEVVTKIQKGPKEGYLDSQSLLRDMRNFLVITFPIKKDGIMKKFEDTLDQRHLRFGSSMLETYTLWKASILSAVTSLGVQHVITDESQFLYVMFTLLNQDFDPIKIKALKSIELKRQLVYNVLTTDHHEVAFSKKRWAIGYLESLGSARYGFLSELIGFRRSFFLNVTLHQKSFLAFRAIMLGRKKSTLNKDDIRAIEACEEEARKRQIFGAEITMGILIDNYNETEQIKSELAPFFGKYQWKFHFETSIASDMFRSALPAHYNLKAGREVMLFDKHALCFLNFKNFRRDFSKSGVILVGEDFSPRFVNVFDSQAFGTMISGGSGAGKTMFAQYMLLSHIVMGHRTIVIDPIGNFEALCESVGGNYYRIGLSDICRGIDCFPAMSYDELQNNKDVGSMTLSFVERLITLGAIGEKASLSARDRSILQRGLDETYRGAPRPDVQSLKEVLDSLAMSSIGSTADVASEFSAALEMFLPTGLYGKLITTDPMSLDSPLTVFDISELRDRVDLIPLAIYGLMTKLSTLIMGAPKAGLKYVAFVDETHYLIKDLSSAKFLKDAVRVWRTYDSAVVLITQQLTDMLENVEIGSGIFKTLVNFFILKQSPTSITEGQPYIGFNSAEAEAMQSLKTEQGKYSFLSYYTRSLNPDGNPAFGRFYLALPRYLYWMCTSRGEEKALRNRKWDHYKSLGNSPQDALDLALREIVAEEAAIV